MRTPLLVNKELLAARDDLLESLDAELAGQRKIIEDSKWRRAFRVRVVGLPGPAPWQAPQSAHRENDGEERGHADRDDRPDEEEGSAGLRDLAADTLPHHVDDRDGQPKQRPEENDDVPRSPFGEHQGPVQPDDKDGPSSEVRESPLFETADDVVRQVKRKEEDREQRRDG